MATPGIQGVTGQNISSINPQKIRIFCGIQVALWMRKIRAILLIQGNLKQLLLHIHQHEVSTSPVANKVEQLYPEVVLRRIRWA